MTTDILGRRVQPLRGFDRKPDGKPGVVIGHCEAPQVLIKTDSGEKYWWRRDLTADITCPTCEGTGVVS